MLRNVYTLPEYPCKRDLWDELSAETRPIVVYGMGNGADKLIARFEKYGIEIADFFASDGFVRGHEFHGKRVKSFSEIKAEYDDFIIVLSFASSRPEVLTMLSEINLNYEMYIPDMPVAGEEYFDKDFYNSHYEDVRKAYGVLSDDRSKNIFAAIINYKLTGKMEYLEGAYSDRNEMYSLISKRCVKTYVDAGAYNGDTLREAVGVYADLKRAYLIEPDQRNYKKLEKYVENLEQIEVKLYNAAAWSESGTGCFSTSGNRNSSVNSTKSYQNKITEIPLVSIDEIADVEVDYIKYDVEGAEYEALLGTDRVIKKYSPTLLVSLYHRSKDIFFLINYLAERYRDVYEFSLFRLRCVPAWEINLVAYLKNA